jgi:ABC-type bacteriocin/lantibiotic exporter with double-glycine peptidase domain
VCLRNVLSYYKAEIALERLREWGGTGRQGTSLLGLHYAATQAGFAAQGARAGALTDLDEVKHPCILHVTPDGVLQHYVVYYPGVVKGLYLIGDPVKGLGYLSAGELKKIWISRSVLLLEPGAQLEQWQQQRRKKFFFLRTILKEDVHLLYVALALGAICSLLNLSTAIFSQQLVDHILPGRRLNALYLGLGSLGLLLILKGVFSFLRQDLLIRQGYGFNLRIMGSFYRSILYLRKSFFDQRQTGDLTARLNDSLRIQQAVSYVLGDMAIQGLLLLIALGFLFVYCWPIALGCLCMIPVVFGVVRFFQADIVQGQREVMIAHARNESNYVDSIRGMSTIKAMNRQPFFNATAAGYFRSLQDAVLKLGKTRIRFSFLLEVVTSLFLLGVIGWAAVRVLQGSLHIGGLIAIVQLAGVLMQTVITVALTNVQVQEAAVALDRLYEFTLLEPEFMPPVTTGPDAFALPVRVFKQKTAREGGMVAPESFRQLIVDKVGFRFPGRKLLLQEVSLELKKGEIVVMAGESGQGKSTLLQVLQQFYPYDGHVRCNGLELSDIHIPDWRQLIGVVPQDIAVFSGPLIANLSLNPTVDAENLVRFCREYGFDRYFEQWPQSYATILGEGGVALSGGQRQLLALARCLYAGPQLLLLDEPTSAMDAATERFVIGVLQRYRRQAGILVISHKDSLTQIADRLYVLESGVTRMAPVTVTVG